MKAAILSALVFVMFSAAAVQAQTVQRTYYETGELRFESTTVNGVPHGITREYDKDGTVLNTYRFQKGELVEKLNEKVSMDFGRLGRFRFLTNPLFWVILIGGGLLTWFLFAKFAFKKRPL